MNNRGGASNNNDGEHNRKGTSQEPDVTPLDYSSAEQKARERGGWVREAILKGVVSGTIREAMREALDHLDF